MMRKMVYMCAVGGLAFVAVVLVDGLADGLSVREVAGFMKSVVEAHVSRKTVADRVQEIETKRPGLVAVAHEMRGDLTILVFKRERMVELWASGWSEPRMYAMTGFSGRLGPKLQEGDGQIPEGVYAVEYLNPNSRFHLSLKVSYPNGFDRARAKADGRTELGGDIMIHGGEATVGCIPIGDEGVEEVFYLVEKARVSHVKIVIAPYDMRSGRERSLEKKVGIPWYAALCDGIEKALQKFRVGLRTPQMARMRDADIHR